MKNSKHLALPSVVPPNFGLWLRAFILGNVDPADWGCDPVSGRIVWNLPADDSYLQYCAMQDAKGAA